MVLLDANGKIKLGNNNVIYKNLTAGRLSNLVLIFATTGKNPHGERNYN